MGQTKFHMYQNMQKAFEWSVIEGNQCLKMEDSSVKNNMSTPQGEGQMPSDDELKKLRKREQRALERLQEARKAQARALERFQRAEARLQKRSARLVLLRQQLEQIPAQPGRENSEAPPLSHTPSDPDSSRVGVGLAPALETDISHTPSDPDSSRVGAGLAPALETDISHTPSNPAPSRVGVGLAPALVIPPLGEDTEQLVNDARAAAEAAEENARLAAERASEIVGIEEEEELTAALTAGTIAHITAERAAKAEVIAEISSKQTREAHRHAQEAEQTLVEVRAAIRSGALSGEEAQEALWRAELAVTRAQAFLADAEANEEQAVKAAMNAEADAEVAEGMAFAAVDRVALLLAADEPQDNSEASTYSAPVQQQTPENDDEADITTKISVMRSQEQP